VAGVTAPGSYTARLLGRTRLSADTYQLDLDRPSDFRFDAGQGIRLSRGGLVREYTLVSGPADPQLSLCVQVVSGGRFSPLLAELSAGSSLSFSGPHGFFTFQDGPLPAVFVAAGTGIAPFVSMAKAGATGFTLLHGARTLRDLHYREALQSVAGDYHGCISRETAKRPGRAWVFKGRVTDFLRQRMPAGAFAFYACGRREMIREAISIIDERFPDSRVFFEVFF